jgi:hypothetical protein
MKQPTVLATDTTSGQSSVALIDSLTNDEVLTEGVLRAFAPKGENEEVNIGCRSGPCLMG